jgi:nicotinamide mononucleotide transporter|tara:strand:- start:621 stop:1208 length:588 start_codon:yes stop_codon:yes gene_type:complete
MFDFILAMSLIEIFGLISGTLAVWLLIKQNIWTWPIGIAYIVASLYIFYSARLYADLALHIFYLIMSFYGWYYWLKGGNRTESTLPVSSENHQTLLILLALCAIAIFISGTLFATYTDADLPYWDNTTSILSLLAMWLQSRKKLESWVLWLLIDILAVGIYFYKEIYFYSLLYIIYIGMAFMGYIAWHKSYRNQH